MSNRDIRDVRQALLRARGQARVALAMLTVETEYLREELEEHLARVQVLLGKMDRDDALRHDRDVLHASVPPACGMLEYVGGSDGNSDGN